MLAHWREIGLFDQVKNLRKGSPPWVFYEGPPTANGSPGLHHVCYACEDVHTEAERLLTNGLQEIDLPRGPDGRRNVAFFHPRSTGGILTELIPVRPALLDTPRVHRSA